MKFIFHLPIALFFRSPIFLSSVPNQESLISNPQWENQMTLEPKTRSLLPVLLFVMGLVGMVYSLWNILLVTDLKAIPSLVVSILCMICAYGYLIRDNDNYPQWLSKIVYLILIFFLFIWALSNAYFSGNTADAHCQMVLAILILALFFGYIFTLLWKNRIR
jgi:hypothetical protein